MSLICKFIIGYNINIQIIDKIIIIFIENFEKYHFKDSY